MDYSDWIFIVVAVIAFLAPLLFIVGGAVWPLDKRLDAGSYEANYKRRAIHIATVGMFTLGITIEFGLTIFSTTVAALVAAVCLWVTYVIVAVKITLQLRLRRVMGKKE